MTDSPRPPLSDLQGKVLAYLVKFLHMNDQLPTNAKIAEAFGWASSNSADTHLKALEKKGYLTRNELHHLMLADRPAVATPLTDKQRLYLAQAWAMLEDYAGGQRSVGNDSIAQGAMASAHVIKLMFAPGFVGQEVAA
jgi:SOS-response transcriptional repressor LexA